MSGKREPEDLMIRVATPADEASAVMLWHRCGLVVSHNDPNHGLRFALAGSDSTVLLAEAQGSVVGTVMVGHDGHRGWVYYLASAPELRLHGVGRAMMNAAEGWLRDLGIRKLQLLVRRSNDDVVDFYKRLGFERSDVVMIQHWLE